MTKTLYIIRHGETDYNRNHIVQGRGVNPSLNETGRKQGLAFYEQYKHVPFEAVLTSTLKRTHETVQAFWEQGLGWEQMAEIDELCWGTHEGKHPTPEMKKDFYHTLNEWRSGNFEARTEEGESAAELADRMQRFIQHLEQRPERHLLVCSHGRSLRALICMLKGETLAEMERYMTFNTALWKAQFDGNTWTLELENDISHLTLPELAPHK